MDTVLVTGANRGIGLELVRCLLALGHRVVATCRQPDAAPELVSLQTGEHLDVRALDVSDAASVAALVSALDGQTIDALINNAGVMRRESTVDDIDYDDWLRTFAINSIAPMRVATAFKQNLLKSARPRVMTVSSQMGSITRAGAGNVAYRSSKAAVNMAMASLAIEWQEAGITVCTVHPGWVRTDMGGSDATLSPPQSAADLAELVASLTPANSGAFLNHDGSPMPW